MTVSVTMYRQFSLCSACFCFMIRPTPTSTRTDTVFTYMTLFRSIAVHKTPRSSGGGRRLAAFENTDRASPRRVMHQERAAADAGGLQDRKSTRLNSSH